MKRCWRRGKPPSPPLTANTVQLAAGLSEINFSTGDHHSKYVSLDVILRAISFTCEAGIPTVVNIELFNKAILLPALKSTFRKWKNRYPHLITRYGLWIPNGGATNLEHSNIFQWNVNQQKHRGCSSVLSTFSIRPDEKLIACCGLYQDYLPHMILGNLKTETIPEIIRRETEQEDFLKIWIAVEGPEAVIAHAAKFNPRAIHAIKQKYVHPCQTCLLVYKKSELREAIRQACEKNMERVYGIYRVANAMTDLIQGRPAQQ